jgi:hypothetical protein
VAHVVGALGWGPYTLKVIMPPASLVAPESAEVIAFAAIAAVAGAVAGAAAVVAVAFWTTVTLIAAPQLLLALLL